MRFRPLIVFARLCGASGLGVFLGTSIAGLLNVLTGSAFTGEPNWLTGAPVLAVFGALTGFTAAWITRRWFAPHTAYRRTLCTISGALLTPLATAVSTGPLAVAVLPVLVGVSVTVTLWVRGFRRETALVRQWRYGRPTSSR